jgi:pimeloyl-ACP methyl ester carboxylesterase
VADIDDLLIALKIDSINLIGVSYSGGLMLAVMQKDPARVRSLILNSPLPTFIPIDEDEPANFNEAITALSDHCRKDSADQALYGDLKGRFQQYFSSIEGKTFSIPYVEKGATDTENIQYTSIDLLDIIENALFDQRHIKDVPFIINEMIAGNHQAYIGHKLDGIFRSGDGPSGMRISVYCADEADYHSEEVIHQLYGVYPYMLGYHINDVYKTLCDCWRVPPIKKATKQPYYSNTPALIADGDMDPACRPLYMDMIHHYMPNSQRMLFINYSHGVGGEEWHNFMMQFLNNPWQKIQSDNKDIIAY